MIFQEAEMKNKRAVLRGGLFFVPILVCLFASCTEFFSTSLAPWAARDPSALIPSVDPGNVQDLITQAENNPDLSLALLKGIQDGLNSASEAEAASLRAAALAAAANASGLGASVLNRAGDITGAIGDPENAKQLVTDAINDMQNLQDTSDTLTAILPDPDTDPDGFNAFVDSSNANDLAMAAAVLLAAEAKKHDDDTAYMESFDPDSNSLTPSEKMTINLAKAAADKFEQEGTDSPLKGVLDGLNLIPH
jgi:hypothetical protein